MSKIILVDADVVSHFITGGEILTLPTIFPFPMKVLDKVYAELERFKERKQEVDNLVRFNVLEVIPFPEENEVIRREYLHIKKMLFKGDGESACMALARYQKHILASSNLRDIAHYCKMHQVLYLTTMDFLCYALQRGVFDLPRCDAFIKRVLDKKAKLPVQRMADFECRDLTAVCQPD